ncbi:hypothetical protein QVD17_38034 [Tagetes erecta]|uniref:Uncharacterized protein n=1 Tax=Tagetes erecta TaxID=13708 RepID=A0AAD8JV38_TARER|nr:hypothetical protein QVD17_38034 [Tagetes erecta]
MAPSLTPCYATSAASATGQNPNAGVSSGENPNPVSTAGEDAENQDPTCRSHVDEEMKSSRKIESVGENGM